MFIEYNINVILIVCTVVYKRISLFLENTYQDIEVKRDSISEIYFQVFQKKI